MLPGCLEEKSSPEEFSTWVTRMEKRIYDIARMKTKKKKMKIENSRLECVKEGQKLGAKNINNAF